MTPDASIAVCPNRLVLSATGNPNGWPVTLLRFGLPGDDAGCRRLATAPADWKAT